MPAALSLDELPPSVTGDELPEVPPDEVFPAVLSVVVFAAVLSPTVEGSLELAPPTVPTVDGMPAVPASFASFASPASLALPAPPAVAPAEELLLEAELLSCGVHPSVGLQPIAAKIKAYLCFLMLDRSVPKQPQERSACDAEKTTRNKPARLYARRHSSGRDGTARRNGTQAALECAGMAKPATNQRTRSRRV